ncbi:MAG: HNH endonuclease [Caldilineaceae bacterium]|nr:HNH endonuclease [Caldilineaceae bacterium]
MSHPRFEVVRRLYRFACGYCGTTETTSGGEMTVDHYMPRAVGGDDELDNLVYACWKCNQYKHDFWPSQDDIAHQRRILHPLLDDLAVHLHKNEQTGQLEALSETGHFHITTLRLNRPQLIRHRLSQQLQKMLQEKHLLLEAQIAELQRTVIAQEKYLAILRMQIGQLRSTK